MPSKNSGAIPAQKRARTLTLRQERFCRAYVQGPSAGNGAAALRDAYRYDSDSRRGTMYVHAYRLKQNPYIRHRIQELEAELVAASKVTEHWVLDRLYAEGTSDDGVRGKTGRVRAIELSGRILNMITEKQERSVVGDVTFALAIGERDLRPVPPALDSGPPALALDSGDQGDSDQGGGAPDAGDQDAGSLGAGLP